MLREASPREAGKLLPKEVWLPTWSPYIIPYCVKGFGGKGRKLLTFYGGENDRNLGVFVSRGKALIVVVKEGRRRRVD